MRCIAARVRAGDLCSTWLFVRSYAEIRGQAYRTASGTMHNGAVFGEKKITYGTISASAPQRWDSCRRQYCPRASRCRDQTGSTQLRRSTNRCQPRPQCGYENWQNSPWWRMDIRTLCWRATASSSSFPGPAPLSDGLQANLTDLRLFLVDVQAVGLASMASAS